MVFTCLLWWSVGAFCTPPHPESSFQMSVASPAAAVHPPILKPLGLLGMALAPCYFVFSSSKFQVLPSVWYLAPPLRYHVAAVILYRGTTLLGNFFSALVFFSFFAMWHFVFFRMFCFRGNTQLLCGGTLRSACSVALCGVPAVVLCSFFAAVVLHRRGA